MDEMRRLWRALTSAYADGVRVMRGLPLLFGAIVLWEFTQHVIEYHIGFFESRAAAKAVSMDGSRMILGWMKMILVYVGGFFAIRYLVLGREAAMKPGARASLRYLPYIAYALLIFAVVFYAGKLVTAPWVNTVRGVVGLGQIAIEPLLMLWIVSAATDGPIHNPLQSARVTGWFYFWALALFFVGRLPVGLAHQFLGTYAIGKPHAPLWPMLVLDALVVGLLIATIPALYVRVARRVADARTDVPILPVRQR